MNQANNQGCCAHCEENFRSGDSIYLADIVYGNDRREVLYFCCPACRDLHFQDQDQYLRNGVREAWFVGE